MAPDLKSARRLTVRARPDRRWPGMLIVRRDRQELRCELRTLADIDELDAIGRASSSSMIEIFKPFGVGQK